MIEESVIPKSVIIIPYRDDKILMQLRDDKEDIVFPGEWGFFSGSFEPGETPLECAHRELYEELGFKVNQMYPLAVDSIDVPSETVLHSFYCCLPCSVDAIDLQEGYDLGLFSLQEICTQQLYSPKARRYFPIVSHPIMFEIANKCFSCVATMNGPEGL